MRPEDLKNLGLEDGGYDPERNAAETGNSSTPLYTVDLENGSVTSKNVPNLFDDFMARPADFMPLILGLAVLWLLWRNK